MPKYIKVSTVNKDIFNDDLIEGAKYLLIKSSNGAYLGKENVIVCAGNYEDSQYKRSYFGYVNLAEFEDSSKNKLRINHILYYDTYGRKKFFLIPVTPEQILKL